MNIVLCMFCFFWLFSSVFGLSMLVRKLLILDCVLGCVLGCVLIMIVVVIGIFFLVDVCFLVNVIENFFLFC